MYQYAYLLSATFAKHTGLYSKKHPNTNIFNTFLSVTKLLLYSRKKNTKYYTSLFHYGVGTVIIAWHVHVAMDSWNNSVVAVVKWFPSNKFSRSSRGTNYFVIFIISPHISYYVTATSACARKKQIMFRVLFGNREFGQPRGLFHRLPSYRAQNWQHLLVSLRKWILIRDVGIFGYLFRTWKNYETKCAKFKYSCFDICEVLIKCSM